MSGGSREEPPPAGEVSPKKERKTVVLGHGSRHVCEEYACGIQNCLRRNNFDAKACQWSIDGLKECCRRLGQNSIHCAPIDTD